MSLRVTDKEIQKLIKQLGYKGCKNCQLQIAPLRSCKWAEQGGDGRIHLICPMWIKKEMSVVFKGVEVPIACCFVDGEHFEHCRFYNVCKQRETIKTNYKPSDCPVKELEQEPVLDKVRAEIKALSNANPSYWHSGDMVDRDDVLEIIDKYKAEQE